MGVVARLLRPNSKLGFGSGHSSAMVPFKHHARVSERLLISLPNNEIVGINAMRIEYWGLEDDRKGQDVKFLT